MSLLMVRKSAPAHAADAHIDDIDYKYKVGDKIKTPDGVGTVQKKTHTNSGKPAYEVKLDKGGIVVHVEQSVSAASVDAGDEVIAQKNGYKLVHNTLNDGYWFYTKSGAGWGLTATNKVAAVNEFNRLVDSAKDSAASVDSNAEEIVNHDRIPVDQLGGEANARKHGYIIAKKGGRVYGVHIDGYSDNLAKKTIEEAGYTVVGDAAD